MAKLYVFGLMCMAFLPILVTCILQDINFKGVFIFVLSTIFSVGVYWVYTIIPSNVTDSVTMFFSEFNHIFSAFILILVLSSFIAYKLHLNKKHKILNLDWPFSRSKLEFDNLIKLYFSYKKWNILIKNFNWSDVVVKNSNSMLCIISLSQVMLNSMPHYEALQKVFSKARSIRHKLGHNNPKRYLVVLSENELHERLFNNLENPNIIFLHYKNLNDLTKMPPFNLNIIDRPYILNSTQRIIAESSEDLSVELANFFWKIKEHDQAIEWGRNALNLKKSVENYIRLSDYYNTIKDTPNSRSVLTEALQFFAKDSRIVKRLAA